MPVAQHQGFASPPVSQRLPPTRKIASPFLSCRIPNLPHRLHYPTHQLNFIPPSPNVRPRLYRRTQRQTGGTPYRTVLLLLLLLLQTACRIETVIYFICEM
jgi:hypothetical protein